MLLETISRTSLWSPPKPTGDYFWKMVQLLSKCGQKIQLRWFLTLFTAERPPALFDFHKLPSLLCFSTSLTSFLKIFSFSSSPCWKWQFMNLPCIPSSYFCTNTFQLHMYSLSVCCSFEFTILTAICAAKNEITVREGWRYQIGWIFEKIPNGLRPHPSFL